MRAHIHNFKDRYERQNEYEMVEKKTQPIPIFRTKWKRKKERDENYSDDWARSDTHAKTWLVRFHKWILRVQSLNL